MTRPTRALTALPLLLLLPALTACNELPEPAPILTVHYANATPQWGWEQRQIYYFTPQGTQLHGLRYSWMRHLRQPFSDERLADPQQMTRFGFLYDDQSTDQTNPGRFPLGFTFHTDPDGGDPFLDITCAACHTGQLNYDGVGVRIDGGAAFHAVGSTEIGQFAPSLVASLAYTYVSPIAFDAFARRVLGTEYPQRKASLRSELGTTVAAFVLEAWNGFNYYPTKDGFGRIDALGHIANAVFADELNPENYRVADAPVNYPHVWDIWKFDWVQWNGSVAQPMGRNVGEALGVKALIALVGEQGNPLPARERYASSVLVRELHCVESTLWHLDPPTWPKEVFGVVDKDKALRGQKLFLRNCRGCHGPHRYSKEKQLTPDKPVEWKMTLIPTIEIGTDSRTADNFADYRYDASVMDPSNPLLAEIGSGWALDAVTGAVIARKYQELRLGPEEQREFDGFGRKSEVQVKRAYKARPLHGIWATPPFLHNGSVRTLYQLLQPAEERDEVFYIATREYDPKHLGYVDAKDVPGAFEFDTRLPGNSNGGHQFRDDGGAGVIGGALSHEERLEIIEFLKVYGQEQVYLELPQPTLDDLYGTVFLPEPTPLVVDREPAAKLNQKLRREGKKELRAACESPDPRQPIQGPAGRGRLEPPRSYANSAPGGAPR